MAKLCTNCGNPLPRDDARFCNNCGSIMASSPADVDVVQAADIEQQATQVTQAVQTAQTGQAMSREMPSSPDGNTRPPLREQIAFPSWPTNRLDRPAAPAAPIAVHGKPARAWDTPGAIGATKVETPASEQKVSRNAPPVAQDMDEIDLEDLPTSQVSIPSPEQLRRPPLPLPEAASPAYTEQQPFPTPLRQPWLRPSEVSGSKVAFESPGQAASTAGPRLNQPSPAPQVPPVMPVPQRAVVQRPITPPISMPGIQPNVPTHSAAYSAQYAQPAAPQTAVRQAARRGGKSRLLIVGVLLVVLLAGGVVTWLVAFHPFEVPAITQTTVSFQNVSLGVSLQYPQGWTARLDTQHSAAYFYDANHTDQFNLNESARQSLSVNQYIKNTTAQQNMTGQKTLAPVTFAGQSWQQVRGSVLLSGATYTETLLVTSHARRLYALLLMAPASTFTNADRLFFAPMRASFRFI